MRRSVGIALAGLVLLAAGAVATAAWSQGEGERWNVATGVTWAQYSPEQKLAYLEGFLAGSGLADAERAVATADTAALGAAVDSLVRWGGLRFAYGAWVYASQLDDHYWWDTHTNTRMMFSLREINQRIKARQ